MQGIQGGSIMKIQERSRFLLIMVTLFFLFINGSVLKAETLRLQNNSFNNSFSDYQLNSPWQGFIVVAKYVYKFFNIVGVVETGIKTVRAIGQTTEEAIWKLYNAIQEEEMMEYNKKVISSTLTIEQIYPISYFTMNNFEKTENGE